MPGERKARTPVATQACQGHVEERRGFSTQASASRPRPLLYRLSHVVSCKGLKAVVRAEGRVLMAREAGEWWCHGVEPGGLTENAPTVRGAIDAFCSSFVVTLDDLAGNCGSFEAFEREARMLFNIDTIESARWHQALARMPADPSELEEPFRGMSSRPVRPSVLSIGVLATDSGATVLPELPDIMLLKAA